MQREGGVIQLKRNVSIFYSHVWIFPYGKNRGVIFAIGLQIVATIYLCWTTYRIQVSHMLLPKGFTWRKERLSEREELFQSKIARSENKFCLLSFDKFFFAP